MLYHMFLAGSYKKNEEEILYLGRVYESPGGQGMKHENY